MTWIKTIGYEDATGSLLKLYDRIKGPDNHIDNILRAHSLRPHTLEGHMSLYKHVLHHSGNSVARWFLEAMGTWTSLLNKCEYCVEHHHAGMRRLLGDDERANIIRSALESGKLSTAFKPNEVVAMEYARALTTKPEEITAADIDALRNANWDDGEILEINQVIAYFNYANRTVLGLGVTTEGDILGLSPGDTSDSENWKHQ